MSFFGNLYKASGGDDALANRYAKLQQIAYEEGMLGSKSQHLLPTGLKSAFFRTVDLLSRPNFAIAGIFDVLSGTAAPGETVGSRVLNEMMGRGERESFGDVLKQRGLEEGKLFDVGLPFTEAKLPVSVRGMAGLALDVFLDPLTYVTNVGALTKVLGRGGEVVGVGRKGMDIIRGKAQRRFLTAAFKSGQITAEQRKVMGKMLKDGILDQEMLEQVVKNGSEQVRGWDWVRDLTRKETLDHVLPATASAEVDALMAFARLGDDALLFSPNIAGADAVVKASRAFGQDITSSPAMREFAERAGLLEERAIRFGDLGVFGSTFKGVKIVETQALTKPVRAMGARMARIINGMGGEGFLNEGRAAIKNLDKAFNSIPFLARQNPIYKQIRMSGFAMKQSAKTMAIHEARYILRGSMGNTHKDKDLWQKFAYAADNATGEQRQRFVDDWVTAAGEKLGLSIDESMELLNRHRERMKLLYARELREGFQTHDPFEFYFPHVYNRKITEDEATALREVFRRRGLGAMRGSNLSGFEMERRFPHISQAVEAVKEAKISGLEIVTDPTEALIKRFEAHFEGMANAFVERNSVYLFGRVTRPALKGAISGLMRSPGLARYLSREVGFEVADAELHEMVDQLARAAALQGDEQLAELATILTRTSTFAETPTARTAAIRKGIDAEFEARPAIRNIRKLQREEQLFREQAATIRTVAKGLTQRGKAFGTASERFRTKKRLAEAIRDAPRLSEETIEALGRNIQDIFRERGLVAAREGTETGSLILPRVIESTNLIRDLLDPAKPLALMTARQLNVGASSKRIDEVVRGMRDAIDRLKGELPEQQAAALSALDDIVRLKGAIRESEVARKIAAGQAGRVRKAAVEVQEIAQRRQSQRLFAEYQYTGRGQLAEGGRPRLTPKELKAKDVQRLEQMRPELRDAVLVEMFRNAKDARHLLAMTEKYGHIWRRMGTKEWNRLKRIKRSLSPDMTKHGVAGEKMVRYKFDSGPLKGQEYDLPEGIIQDFANFKGKWMANPEVKGLLRGWDMMTNAFKTLVTMPFLAFHFRNMYSNVYLANLDIGLAALNPKRHIDAINILRGKDGTLSWRGPDGKLHKETFHAIRKQMEGLDIRVEGFRLAELTGREADTALLPNRLLHRAVRPFSKFLAAPIENEARAMHYIALRQRGLSHIDSAERMKQYIFDYGWLSPTEKNVWRRIVPFYTFQSKNLRLELRRLVEAPGRAITPVKPFRERGPDNDMLPEYLRGELKLGINTQKGKAFLTNIDLPINDVNILWQGNLGDTLLRNIGLLNPLLKAPFEIGFGMDSFTQRSLRGSQWMGQMGPLMARFPKPLREYLELREVPLKDGTTGYKANGTKAHLLLKGSFLSRILTTTSIVDDMVRNNDKVAVDAWKIMTGLQVREFDLTEGQRRKLKNQYDRLEQHLLDKGLMAQFTKAFVPAEKRAGAGGFFGR